MRKIVSSFIIVLLVSQAVHAGGGWPQNKGALYLKFSQWWLVADQHYTSQGLIDPNVTAGLFNTNIYAEYGITDRFTVATNIPIFSRTTLNDVRSSVNDELLFQGGSLNGIGDAEIQLKYGLIKNSALAISGSMVLGLPLGQTEGGVDGNLQLGDGEFNQGIRFDVGIPFRLGETNAYTNLYTGFNNRTSGFSDEWRSGIELGLGLFQEQLWVAFKLDDLQSFKNGGTAADSGTSVFANNTEFTSLTFEANYFINKKWGVSANFSTAFRGEIIYAAPSYSIGFFYKG